MPNDPIFRNGNYNTEYVYETPNSTRSVPAGTPYCWNGTSWNPAYTSQYYYLWTGLDVPNSSLANAASISWKSGNWIQSAKDSINNPPNPPQSNGQWNLSYPERQNVNNFFVIKGGQ